MTVQNDGAGKGHTLSALLL